VSIGHTDCSLREPGNKDLPLIHDCREIKTVVLLGNDIPDQTGAEEGIQTREDRNLRSTIEQGEFLVPKRAGSGILDGREEVLAKRCVEQGLT